MCDLIIHQWGFVSGACEFHLIPEFNLSMFLSSQWPQFASVYAFYWFLFRQKRQTLLSPISNTPITLLKGHQSVKRLFIHWCTNALHIQNKIWNMAFQDRPQSYNMGWCHTMGLHEIRPLNTTWSTWTTK